MAMDLPPVTEVEELSRSYHVTIISVEGLRGRSPAELVKAEIEKLEGVSKVKVCVKIVRLQILKKTVMLNSCNGSLRPTCF